MTLQSDIFTLFYGTFSPRIAVSTVPSLKYYTRIKAFNEALLIFVTVLKILFYLDSLEKGCILHFILLQKTACQWHRKETIIPHRITQILWIISQRGRMHTRFLSSVFYTSFFQIVL